MSLDQHKRPASGSPPMAWQRQRHPPAPPVQPPSSPPPTQAFISTSHQEPLKPDISAQPVPAPAYIDIGALKAEKEAVEARAPLSLATSAAGSATSLSSPTSMHGPGQPPPYSRFPPTSVSTSTSAPTSITPTAASTSFESRRASRDDKPPGTLRQSLPSISEALNLRPIVSQAHQSSTSAAHPPPTFSQAAGLTDRAYSVTSGSPNLARSHLSSQQPSSMSSYSSQHSPHDPKPPDPTPVRVFGSGIADSPSSTHYDSFVPRTPASAELHARRMSPGLPQHSHTSLPPPNPAPHTHHLSYPSPAAPNPLQSASSQPTHPSYPITAPSGQTEIRALYPTGTGFSFPPPASSGMSYQDSLAAATVQQQWAAHADMEKVDEMRRQASVKRQGSSGQGYGMVVKRHLEEFDVEHGLNEVAERTGAIFDFSKRYSAQAFRYSRVPVPVDQLPKNEVIIDMINHSIAVTDALHRLRSTVEGMHLAAEENARQQQQQSAMAKPGMYPSYVADSAGRAGLGVHTGQDNVTDKGDLSSNGYNGPDAKKRRGRNAPPGRCHSCNRAETPEWRRGPDGARTLCNACGLHYAKLTRKMGKSSAQPNGSSLRPKKGEDAMA